MDLLKRKLLNKKVHSSLSSHGYQVGDIDGDKIYTDEEVKQKFIDIISNQDTLKPVLKKISTMIEIDHIIPVYVKFGLLEKIRNFFFANSRKFATSKHVMAFYDPSQKRIVMLIENIQNGEYWNKQEALSLVLLHEFQHMMSYQIPNRFMSIHRKTYQLYYKKFIESYFGVAVSNKDAFEFAIFLHNTYEKLEDPNMTYDKFYSMYYDILNKMLKHNDINRNHSDQITSLIKSINLYFRNSTEYHKRVVYKSPNELKVFNSLADGYKSLKILRTSSLYIQELFACSEVICIESEYNTNKRHLLLINNLE